MRRPIPVIFLAAACAAAVAFVTGEVTERVALARFEARANSDARLRQALLASEVARFRILPQALAADRDLVAAVQRPSAATARTLNLKLEALAAQVGAAVIYVIGPDGVTLGASNWRSADSFVGETYGFRPYFRDALRLGSGEQFALGTVSRKPGLYLATRGIDNTVVVVKLEFDKIEAQWRAADGITFVTDRNGIIVVTSRPAWRFAATRPLSAAVRQEKQDTTGVEAVLPAPFAVADDGAIVPSGEGDRYIVAATPPDEAGWQVNLALPLDPAVTGTVRTAQAVAALLTLLLLGLAMFFVERGRQRRDRTALLEAAVADRTAQLRREIAERAAAEQRASELREGLRQANRLATLGQVTASVAHETAQPVAAIRNHATATEMLLDRRDEAGVRDNLKSIARLADRIGLVTAQLRSFARKGSGQVDAVPLEEVIEGALLILKERLTGIAFDLRWGERGLRARGERIRLEQVLVNLIQNAVEALEGTARPQIVLSIEAQGDTIVLRLQDNGPGIDPEIAPVLFTPFSTSRSSGLGLGLVIAKDIAEEFGGTLSLVPGRKGACFEVTLVRAR